MRKEVFYVVFAADGVLVHKNYVRAVICRDKYFRSPCTIRKFESLDEAIDNARDHLITISNENREIPEMLNVDQLYYVRKLPRKW